MAEPIRAKNKIESHLPKGNQDESSELYESVLSSRPASRSNEDAANDVNAKLERLAATHGVSVDALIEQAHTTRDSKPVHIEALQLERQLGFLRR